MYIKNIYIGIVNAVAYFIYVFIYGISGHIRYSSIILKKFDFLLSIDQSPTLPHILIKKYIRRQLSLKLQLKHLIILIQQELLNIKIIKASPPISSNPMIIDIMSNLNILAIVTNHTNKSISHKLSFYFTIIFLFYCYSISM